MSNTLTRIISACHWHVKFGVSTKDIMTIFLLEVQKNINEQFYE